MNLPCFFEQNVEERVLFGPDSMGNLANRVIVFLNERLLKYSEALRGVFVSYSEVKISSRSGAIVDELPHVHVDLRYKSLVFRPTAGTVVRSVVTRATEWSIACLVFGTFNATIFVPKTSSESDWPGSSVKEGDVVTIRVIGLEESKGTVNIRAEFA